MRTPLQKGTTMSENPTVVDAEVVTETEKKKISIPKLSKAKIVAAVAVTGAAVMIIASKVKRSKNSSDSFESTDAVDSDENEG